jgi:VIT1/CCC1 family predicted Fe2+/Mn2+ transporter
MEAGLSDREAAAFAAIVGRLGDPEQRRLRRAALATGVGGLVPLASLLLFVLRWPWAAVVSFALTFVLGLATGLLLVGQPAGLGPSCPSQPAPPIHSPASR